MTISNGLVSNGLGCEILAVGKSHVDELVALGKQKRWSWGAVFSCNFRQQVWVPPGYGHTPKSKRVYLQGRNELLDELVKIYLEVRPEGERFFVNESGAAPQDRPRAQFVQFIVGEGY